MRSRRAGRTLPAVLAVVCAGGALYTSSGAVAQKGAGGGPAPAPAPAPVATTPAAAATPSANPASATRSATPSGGPAAVAEVARGRTLFLDGCSSCHGADARGVSRQGPSLYGVGAAAADFYLSTGRMPLANPRDQPARGRPTYGRADIRALVAYVGSLGAGPPVPAVALAAGRVNKGMEAFTDHCAGCHQVGGAGGIVTGAIAPALDNPDVTPAQIAEAVRVGPYVMPVFGRAQVSDQELNDIVRYVVSTQHPQDRGGWGIGHVGPIPEGMIAWFLAITALLLVARLIGERNPRAGGGEDGG